jgi:1-phosphatidylinositol-4-phosphate 5-kinase
MIKTQTKEENKFMKRILPSYYNHVATNPHTLIVHILGMHRVKMYHLRRKVHFVIMTSVFDTPQKIHTIYDLKGSTIGREATEKERENGGVLKDMDLLKSKRKLHFGSKKEMIMRQLENDSNFLSSLNIMDYSLLIGIHYRKLRESELDNSNHDNSNMGVSHSNTPFRRMSQSSITVGASTSQRGSIYSERVEEYTENAFDTDVDIDGIELSLGDDGNAGVDDSTGEDGGGVNDDTYDDEDSIDSEDDDGDSVWESDEDKVVRVSNSDPYKIEGITNGSTIGNVTPSRWSWLSDLFSCTSNNAVMISDNAPSEVPISDANGNDVSVVNGIKYSKSFDNSFSNYAWTTRKDFGINSEIEGERGDEIYYVGIIDILQQYNVRKRGENLMKSITHDSTQISSVHPQLYASRFSKFITENSD